MRSGRRRGERHLLSVESTALALVLVALCDESAARSSAALAASKSRLWPQLSFALRMASGAGRAAGGGGRGAAEGRVRRHGLAVPSVGVRVRCCACMLSR